MVNKKHNKWEVKREVNLVEVICFEDCGERIRYSREYLKGDYFSDIKIEMSNSDVELKIVPLVLEHFEIVFKSSNPGELKRLFAGIRDKRSVGYIGKCWLEGNKDSKFENMYQFFFDNDKLSGLKMNKYQGPSWSLAHLPLVTETIKPYFEELKKLRPESASSIEKCVELLSLNHVELRERGISD